MSTKLEIERKFLVKFPTSWSQLCEMFDDLIEIKRISQTYLIAEKNQPSLRIRKTLEGLTGETKTVYHINKKKLIDSGIHKEFEKEISKEKYEKYLEKAHPDKIEVQKIRFLFKYKNQVFELDLFKGPLKGLAILEIELENKNDVVIIPTFFKIIKEVTKDKKYNNYNLADKKNFPYYNLDAKKNFWLL